MRINDTKAKVKKIKTAKTYVVKVVKFKNPIRVKRMVVLG